MNTVAKQNNLIHFRKIILMEIMRMNNLKKVISQKAKLP